MKDKKLTELQKAFVDEYPKDFNGAQAFWRAQVAIGKKKSTENAAAISATKMLRNTKVTEALTESLKARRERVKIDQDWVLKKLIENVEKAMQAVPVLDREGNETGMWTYQGRVANEALALLAKHVGGFNDKLDINISLIPVVNTMIVQVSQIFIQIVNDLPESEKLKEAFGSQIKMLLEKQFPNLPMEKGEGD